MNATANVKRVVVTGGAGFIGANVSRFLAASGFEVVVYDNLSRAGAAENLKWLKNQAGVEFIRGDVRDLGLLKKTLKSGPVQAVVHLAAQTAVTESLRDPLHDFSVNAAGTLNVLEAVRQCAPEALVVFSSTNKVYGSLAGSKLGRKASRYVIAVPKRGISENFPIEFASPYGCSKGAADQYVRDYARSFGLRTVCLRFSCIYGPHQFGVEDQGWIAWFTIAVALGKTITICGDGLQSRDLLYVDDLTRLILRIIKHPGACAGRVFNVGGGSGNVLSLKEALEIVQDVLGTRARLKTSSWRVGDQKAYVSDLSGVRRATGWRPKVGPREGISMLAEWVVQNRDVIREVLGKKR